MKIIVCVKQVPNSNLIKIDPEKGTLIREGVPSIINPDDKNALEEALRIKEKFPDTSVTVISMGPLQAKYALREALAMGADEAILLSDYAFAGSDTRATASILASAIRKIGQYDIIICGRQAIDGDTAQVGPQVAEYLNIPQITYVSKLEIEGSKISAHRAVEDGYFIINSQMPILLTAIKELNIARIPSISGIRKAFQTEIKAWSADDLDVNKNLIGLSGSPTRVLRSFTPQRRKAGEILSGSTSEAVSTLLAKLQARHAI